MVMLGRVAVKKIFQTMSHKIRYGVMKAVAVRVASHLVAKVLHGMS